MKKIFLLSLLSTIPIFSQYLNPIIFSSTDPSGSCPARHIDLSLVSGNAFYCNPLTGNWLQLSTGSSTYSPTGTGLATVSAGSTGTTLNAANGLYGITETSSVPSLTALGTAATQASSYFQTAISGAPSTWPSFGTASLANTASVCTGNNWSQGWTTGSNNCAQLAFSNISGTASAGQIPAALSSTTSVNGTTIPSSQTLVYSGGPNSLYLGAVIGNSPTSMAVLYADSSGNLQNAAGVLRTGIGQLTHTITSLGTTPASAIILQNTTAAASGSQQISPSLTLQGSGWGTTAGAAANVSFSSYVLPVQGLTPTPTLIMYPSADSTKALQIDNAAQSATVLDIDTTNNRVGIGTTSPNQVLTVQPTTNDTGLQVNLTGGGAGVQLYTNSTRGALALFNSSTSTVSINAGAGANSYFNSGGNVGIGTTSPSVSLEVDNNSLAATTVISNLIANTTASTSGVPVQISPASEYLGHAWNTTATAADNYVRERGYLTPVSGSTPTGKLNWDFSIDTGTASWVNAASLTNGGTLTLAGGLVIGSSSTITYNINTPAANTVVCYKTGGILGWASNTSGVIGTTCN